MTPNVPHHTRAPLWRASMCMRKLDADKELGNLLEVLLKRLQARKREDADTFPFGQTFPSIFGKKGMCKGIAQCIEALDIGRDRVRHFAYRAHMPELLKGVELFDNVMIEHLELPCAPQPEKTLAPTEVVVA